MRGYQIAMIVSIAIFAIGIVLSLLFNTFFLFLFLPIGIGWGFWRRKGPQSDSSSVSMSQDTRARSYNFCTSCEARLNEKDLFCPNCGKSIQSRIDNSDLR